MAGTDSGISFQAFFFFLFTVRSVIIYNILAEKYQELFGDMYLAATNFPTLAVHIKNLEPRSETRQPAGSHEIVNSLSRLLQRCLNEQSFDCYTRYNDEQSNDCYT